MSIKAGLVFKIYIYFKRVDEGGKVGGGAKERRARLLFCLNCKVNYLFGLRNLIFFSLERLGPGP